MQIFYLSPVWLVITSLILWPVFQLLAIFISRILPSSFFAPNNCLFKERRWEGGGKLYENVFKIKKWKKFLPDGAAVKKDGYKKKHLRDFSEENLTIFIEETCRGELGHLLAIIPFWVFGLFGPPIILLLMFIYAILVNVPCIIAQRYNRPRVIRLKAQRASRRKKRLS